MPLPDVVAVVGPTSAGKSDLALALACSLGAEVVSADSMQLYRGMDIGTAKVPVADRRGVPHHLLDVLDIDQRATVAEFQQWARAAIADCRRRGVPAVLVGGSALYVRAVLDRFEFPGTDPAVRARLESELATAGVATLHARLAVLDPASAATIDATNGRRIVRALEVVEITGLPYRASLPGHEYAYDNVVAIGLDVPRPELDRRIAARVGAMWRAGLIDEVRALEAAGLRTAPTASRALGYAQVLRFLAGELSEQDALEDTVIATRRFARRQDSWFRRDPRIGWLGYDDPDLSDNVHRMVESGATG